MCVVVVVWRNGVQGLANCGLRRIVELDVWIAQRNPLANDRKLPAKCTRDRIEKVNRTQFMLGRSWSWRPAGDAAPLIHHAPTFPAVQELIPVKHLLLLYCNSIHHLVIAFSVLPSLPAGWAVPPSPCPALPNCQREEVDLGWWTAPGRVWLPSLPWQQE